MRKSCQTEVEQGNPCHRRLVSGLRHEHVADTQVQEHQHKILLRPELGPDALAEEIALAPAPAFLVVPGERQGLRIDFGVLEDAYQVIGVEGAGHAFAFRAATQGLFLTQ